MKLMVRIPRAKQLDLIYERGKRNENSFHLFLLIEKKRDEYLFTFDFHSQYFSN